MSLDQKQSPATPRPRLGQGRSVRLPAVLALAIAVLCQWIGVWQIQVGEASISVLPMVWALILGAIVSLQRIRPMSHQMRVSAEAVMGVGVLMLSARIAFTVGPNLGVLADAGPALLLQELGHLGGTIAIALPIAVALRMGRSTVGATFSIDRESSFAIVGARYGVDSDEYRGVLSMYVFGTLFGAVIASLLASLLSSTGIFDPLALAMGAGVGSGSMMAAGAASIAAAHPGQADQVLAMAATSNLITAILGTYVGVWLALPLADRLYRFLTRRAAPAPAKSGVPVPPVVEQVTQSEPNVVAGGTAATPSMLPGGGHVARVSVVVSLALVAAICVPVASIAAKGFSYQIVWGLLIVAALTAVALWLASRVRHKVAAIVWTSALGTYLSSSWSPIADQLGRAVNSVDFLSMCTVVLTFAGLALAKDIAPLRVIGWKIIPVGLSAIVASFVLSTLIAEFSLGLWR